MATIVILGAGMMGSALALPLVDRGHKVRLVGTHLDREIIDHLWATREHLKLRLALPREIRLFHHEELPVALHGAEVVALGVSSRGVRWAMEQLRPFASAGWPVVLITKGLAHIEDRLVPFPELITLELGVQAAAVAGP
ncbi:MAG: glycerol-3-phosphate dehydrogenase, partial [Myxococcales bacterium]|nr:glycerol-3-phosphate dehydrogenase [Polyangiaceae bacterium]MDW8252177.1 glycerol-3-phosphate dehydrogenase [Myxococcales bacterium]